MVISEDKGLKGSNETPEIVDRAELQVDGHNVNIEIDDQGQGHYELPEDVAGDPDRERTFESKLNLELGKTLSKAKQTRFQQNRQKEAMDRRARDMGLVWDDSVGDYIKVDGQGSPGTRATASVSKDDSLGFDDDKIEKAYLDTYNKTIRDEMGAKTDADLEELKDDFPAKYAAAKTKAEARANIAMNKLTARQMQKISKEDAERSQRENALLQATSNSNVNYNAVKRYAEENRVDHLAPSIVITLYKNSLKSDSDGTGQYNKIERIKSVKAKPIANKRHIKRDITEADVASMSREELKEYYDRIGNE